MAGLDLFFLQLSVQCGSRCGDVGELALLALPDGAPRKISAWVNGEAGAAALTAAIAASS